MNVKRGDVVLARYPHTSGGRGKKRPVVVVQSDQYNQRLSHVAVAEITTNLSFASDPACLFIDISTPDGQASGLAKNSVVVGYFLAAIDTDRIDHVIGTLSPALLAQVDACLRIALALP